MHRHTQRQTDVEKNKIKIKKAHHHSTAGNPPWLWEFSYTRAGRLASAGLRVSHVPASGAPRHLREARPQAASGVEVSGVPTLSPHQVFIDLSLIFKFLPQNSYLSQNTLFPDVKFKVKQTPKYLKERK